MRLLVSGIVWTAYGQHFGPNPDYTTFDSKISKGKLKAYYDGMRVGSLLKIVPEFFGGIPVYYGIGVVSKKRTIQRILRSSLGKSTKEISYSNPEYIHSWCADMEYNEYGYEQREKVVHTDWKWSRNRVVKFVKEKMENVYHPEKVEITSIPGASLVRNPCCKFTSIHLPNFTKKQNETLFRLHKQQKYLKDREIALFQSISLDRYKFKHIFGNFSKKDCVNFEYDPKELLKLSNSIEDEQ